MTRLLILATALLASPLAYASDDPDPWTFGVKLSIAALTIGGSAAILGLWVGRDKSRPTSFAIAMTFLIGSAVSVGVVQSYLDSVDGIAKEADLQRMMTMVSEIAVASGDTDLAALIEAEGGPKLEVEPLPEPEPEPVEDEATEGEPTDDELELPEAAPAEPEMEE